MKLVGGLLNINIYNKKNLDKLSGNHCSEKKNNYTKENKIGEGILKPKN